MSVPVQGGVNRIKRVARFLIDHPRFVQQFREQEKCSVLDVASDSDWAEDMLDRTSVSATFVMLGSHLVRSSVTGQDSPSLSSGEAEFKATVKSSSIGIGVRSIGQDFGMELKLVVGTDSSASRGMTNRIGLGKLRHLDTGLLWLQHYVAKGWVTIRKKHGPTNVADLGTKNLAAAEMHRMLGLCSVIQRDGRHPLALKAALGQSLDLQGMAELHSVDVSMIGLAVPKAVATLRYPDAIDGKQAGTRTESYASTNLDAMD